MRDEHGSFGYFCQGGCASPHLTVLESGGTFTLDLPKTKAYCCLTWNSCCLYAVYTILQVSQYAFLSYVFGLFLTLLYDILFHLSLICLFYKEPLIEVLLWMHLESNFRPIKTHVVQLCDFWTRTRLRKYNPFTLIMINITHKRFQQRAAQWCGG